MRTRGRDAPPVNPVIALRLGARRACIGRHRGAPRGARTAVGSWGSTRRAGLPPERARVDPPTPWSVSIIGSASGRGRS